MSTLAQNLLVWLAVAAALAYVAWTIRRSLAAKKACGGCGTCPAGETTEPAVFTLQSPIAAKQADRQSPTA